MPVYDEETYIRIGIKARLRAALSILNEIRPGHGITKEELRELIGTIEEMDGRLCEEDFEKWKAELEEERARSKP